MIAIGQAYVQGQAGKAARRRRRCASSQVDKLISGRSASGFRWSTRSCGPCRPPRRARSPGDCRGRRRRRAHPWPRGRERDAAKCHHLVPYGGPGPLLRRLQNGVRVDAGTGVNHIARLTRLTSGMRYTYTVRADSGVLAEGTFRAAPVHAARFTFAVVGDFGSGNGHETAVASMIESWHPDFVLTVGDNAYPLGAPELLGCATSSARTRRSCASRPGSRRSATTTSRRTAGSPSSRRSTRSATSAGTASRGGTLQSSCWTSNVSVGPDSPQLRFARSALALALLLPLRRLAPPAVGAPGHPHRARPSPQHRAAGREERRTGGVRWPPARLRPKPPAQRGVYVAVGTGGAELDYDAGDLTIPSARVVQGRFGALRVDVAGSRARFRYQTVDGRVRDDFRLSCA